MKARMPKNYDPAFDDNDYSNADYNPRLHHLINEVIENQLRDNDPPEARETLERLMAQGDSEEEAKRKIGAVLVTHIYNIMANNGQYDNEQYCKDLTKIK